MDNDAKEKFLYNVHIIPIPISLYSCYTHWWTIFTERCLFYIVRGYYSNIFESTYPKQNHPLSIVLVRLHLKLRIVELLLNLPALVSRAVLYETFAVGRSRVVLLLELERRKRIFSVEHLLGNQTALLERYDYVLLLVTPNLG